MKRKTRGWLGLAMIAGFSLGGLSAATAESFSVKKAIEQAQRLSPDIRSLRDQVDSARAKTRQALSPGEPSFSITYNDLDRAFDFGNQASTVYSITQPLGFPGKAFVSRASADHAAESIVAQLRAKELEIASNVKTAYSSLALARQNIRLNNEQNESYERILAIAQRRYEAGSITQVDLLNAQISLYSNGNDLADLQSAERGARAQLNVLLGNEVTDDVEIDPLPIPHGNLPARLEAEQKMLNNRPELRAAREQAESAGSNYNLAKLSFLPDFQLTAGTTNYNIASASPLVGVNPTTQTFLVGVQFTIPLWGLFNERESLISASHDKAAAYANVDILNNQSRVALESVLGILDALNKKIDTYQKHLLPLSEQAFKIALVSYSSGKIDFQALVSTADARRSVKRDYFSLLVNYWTNYSSLGQLIGEDL